MNLLQRFGYFGLGLFFGIVILIFFLSGKKASCTYGPNGRVLSNIQSKKHTFSESSLSFFRQNKIDTSMVLKILKNGDVNFRKSITHGDPCNIYYILGNSNSEKELIELQIENCDSIATIQNAKIKKDE